MMLTLVTLNRFTSLNVLQVRTLQLDGVNPQALDFVNLKLTGANNLTSTISFRPKARKGMRCSAAEF